MEITLLQGLLIALAAAIMGIENSWEFTMLYRPLPAAAVVSATGWPWLLTPRRR